MHNLQCATHKVSIGRFYGIFAVNPPNHQIFRVYSIVIISHESSKLDVFSRSMWPHATINLLGTSLLADCDQFVHNEEGYYNCWAPCARQLVRNLAKHFYVCVCVCVCECLCHASGVQSTQSMSYECAMWVCNISSGVAWVTHATHPTGHSALLHQR